MPFFFFGHERGGEREGESFNFCLQYMEIDWSEFVEPRTKVHILNEGCVWVPKTQDFAEVLSKEFRKSKVSGLGSFNGTS